MKPAHIVYSPTAKKYLTHLHPGVKGPLRAMVEELAEEPLRGKPLHDEFEGFRSHRFKRHRILYRYNEPHNRVEILFAGPRAEVYHLFSEYLKKLKS